MALTNAAAALPRSQSPLPRQGLYSRRRSLTPSRCTPSSLQAIRDKRSRSIIRGDMSNQSSRTAMKASPASALEGDCFSTLGLTPSASAPEIRQAYRSLAKKYHPDANPTEDASCKFVDLRSAYEQCLYKAARRSQEKLLNSPAKKSRQGEASPGRSRTTSSPSRSRTASSPARSSRRSTVRRDAWDDIWDEMLSSPQGSRRQR